MVVCDLQEAVSPVQMSPQVCTAKNLLSPRFHFMSFPSTFLWSPAGQKQQSSFGMSPAHWEHLLSAPPLPLSFPAPSPLLSIDFLLLHLLLHASVIPLPQQGWRTVSHRKPISSCRSTAFLGTLGEPRDSFVLLSQSTQEWKWHISQKCGCFSAFLSGPPPLHFILFLTCIFMGNMQWWHRIIRIESCDCFPEKEEKTEAMLLPTPNRYAHTKTLTRVCTHTHLYS